MRIHWSWSLTIRLLGAFVIVAAFVAIFAKPAHGDGTTPGISEDEARAICADWNKIVQTNPGKNLDQFKNTNSPTYDSGGLFGTDVPGVGPESAGQNAPTISQDCSAAVPPIGAVNAACLALEEGKIGQSQLVFFPKGQWSPQSKNACDSLCTYWADNCDQTAPIKSGAPPVAAQIEVKREINVAGLVKIRNGFLFYALLACLVGMCVSASLWAMGNKGQKPGTELTGKNGFLVCVCAAFLLGVVPNWVEWLDNTATQPDLNPSGELTTNQVPVVGTNGIDPKTQK